MWQFHSQMSKYALVQNHSRKKKHASLNSTQNRDIRIRMSQKYTIFIIFIGIQNVAVCIPYKITGKIIGILNGLGHECAKVLIIQRKSQNIQRKICQRIVLTLISHIMVQSIYFLDQIATFSMLFP